MKLLFDENVSPRLAQRLASEFPGSAHVRDAGLRGADDWRIWEYARNGGFAIVSKDTDFRERSYVDGAPPKVVSSGLMGGRTESATNAEQSTEWRGWEGVTSQSASHGGTSPRRHIRGLLNILAGTTGLEPAASWRGRRNGHIFLAVRTFVLFHLAIAWHCYVVSQIGGLPTAGLHRAYQGTPCWEGLRLLLGIDCNQSEFYIGTKRRNLVN